MRPSLPTLDERPDGCKQCIRNLEFPLIVSMHGLCNLPLLAFPAAKSSSFSSSFQRQQGT